MGNCYIGGSPYPYTGREEKMTGRESRLTSRNDPKGKKGKKSKCMKSDMGELFRNKKIYKKFDK